MSAVNDVEAIKKEIRGYYLIFGGLLSLSLMAVALSYMHLPLMVAVVITLAIALVQVFLAAGYFMHLMSERVVAIYFVVATTVGFAVAILILPVIEHKDPITGTTHTHLTHTVAPAEAHDKHAEAADTE